MNAWEEKEIQRLVFRVEQAERQIKELEGWGKRAYLTLQELSKEQLSPGSASSIIIRQALFYAPDSVKDKEAE